MNITVQPGSVSTPGGLPTTTLTCAATNPGCFGVAGTGGTVFEPGMLVTVTGQPGRFTVVSATTDALVLQGTALRPTYTVDPTSGAVDKKVFTPVMLTVRGEDADRDGGTRIGGDRITVGNLASTVDPCRGESGTEAIAGPSSPLVVYGDTSQDGVWYGGEPDSVKGHEFGPKPFDPFWKVPESENEDDEWLFPVADPYVFAGNDVIDASGLFSWITCTTSSCDLPTVGFTAYGGEGPAPGPNRDLMVAGDDTIFGEGAISYTAGRTTLARATVENAGWPQAAYDDIVFGDHGRVFQQVADPNEPDLRLKKIQTTAIASVRAVESRAFQNGGDDTINGDLGRDLIVGGAGDDLGDGDEQDDLLFGDNIFLLRRVVEPALPTATDYTGAIDITSGRFRRATAPCRGDGGRRRST